MTSRQTGPLDASEPRTRTDGTSEEGMPQARYAVLEEVQQTTYAHIGPLTIRGRIADFSHTPGSVSDPMDIYPGLAETHSALKSGLALLDEAIAIHRESVSHSESGNAIGADDGVQRIRALLPELFCCRTIGDGFGVIINAIHYSFVNSKGAPLELSQLRALGNSLQVIRQRPFMGVEEAVAAVISLEEAGFVVAPEGVECFADIEPE